MRWLLPPLVLLGLAAHAHDADVIFAQLASGPAPGVLEESVTLTAATLGLLAPVDADGDGALSQADLDARAKALRAGVWDEAPLQAGGQPCALGETFAELREGYVLLRASFRCGEGELRQDFRILRVLPPNYRVVLGSQLDGEARGQRFAQGSLTAIEVPRPAPPGRWDGSGFERGFHEGLTRGTSALGLAALFALLLAVGAWRRGLAAAGLALGGLCLGSFGALGEVPAISLMLLLVIALAAIAEPPLPLAVGIGLALGLLGGGGAWPHALGLAAGSSLVWVAASPVFMAFGVMLRRRVRWGRLARWVTVVVAVVAGASLLS